MEKEIDVNEVNDDIVDVDNTEDLDNDKQTDDQLRDNPDTKYSFLRSLLMQLLFSFLLFLFLINFVFMSCVVDGTSMYPTLKENDFGYSFIISRNISINRFDIAVIAPDGNKDRLLVKRVIGLPNETVKYVDNKLYINGEYVEETFLQDSVFTGDFEVVLNDDEYYCLGDNRPVSRDSRYYGAFSKKDIISTHLFILSPFKNFGYKK